MARVRRVPFSSVALVAVIGAFALPFGAVTACDERMTVESHQFLTGSPPVGKPTNGGRPDAARDVEQVVVLRGGGFAVAALACAVIGTALGLLRGRRAAAGAVIASAGGVLAVGELALRARGEADAFDPRAGLWIFLGGFALAGLLSLWTLLRLLARSVGLVAQSHKEMFAATVGAIGVGALVAGAVVPSVGYVSDGERSDLYSFVDYLSPAAGHALLWKGLEPVLLPLVAGVALATTRLAPRLRGGILTGLGTVAITAHVALAVRLHQMPASDGDDVASGFGAGAWIAGAALLVVAGLALLVAPADRKPRRLRPAVRVSALAGAGLTVAAVLLPVDHGLPLYEPFQLERLPTPLAYGAGAYAAAAVALAVALTGIGRGLLVGAAAEGALLFLGPVSTFFVHGVRPASGLWLGFAAAAVLVVAGVTALRPERRRVAADTRPAQEAFV